MSDETTRTDGWAEEDASGAAPAQDAAGGAASDPAAAAYGSGWGGARPVAFCQDCGRPLTPETLRAVGKGVFCEPCLENRLGQTPASAYAPGYVPGATSSTTPGTSGAQQGYGAVPPPMPSTPSDQSPFLAGVLGLIPGVGAMYNGQFAKGILHLAIFVGLDLMAENVSGVFWIFVWGWIFYQSFEAYHTAKARLEGLPLPNAFGFNEIGERMGFGKNWGPVSGAGRPAAPPPAGASAAPPSGATATPPGSSSAGASWTSASTATPPVAPPPVAPWSQPYPVGRDWVGYVPPKAFAQADAWQRNVAPGAPPQVPAQPMGAGYTGAGYAAPGYAETFTGAPPAGYAVPVGPDRRFPVGALWLIGLGALILAANVIPDWRISDRWWPPVVLAGLSLWFLTRRMRSGARIACIVRWPVILMVLAVLSALHAAYVVVTFGMTCAVLLIVFGVLLLLERTLGATPAYGGAQVYGGGPVDDAVPGNGVPAAYAPGAEPARAAFTTAVVEPSEPLAPHDEPKGGQ